MSPTLDKEMVFSMLGEFGISGYDSIDGLWSLLGGDYQYYTSYTKADIRTASIAQWMHTASICIGPDGQPWTGHVELEGIDGGGGDFAHGVFVNRWNGSGWIQVSYPTNPDGAVAIDNWEAYDSSSWSTGGTVYSSGLSPQICSDGTNVYICQVARNGGSVNRVQVWKYNGTVWSLLTHTTDMAISSGNQIALACSPNDVGHPVIAYRTNGTTLYVDRWNGSSWDHMGGGALARDANETVVQVAPYRLVLDNSGYPHFLNNMLSLSSSSTVGRNLWMHSWNGSAWSITAFNQNTFGIGSDYRTGGTTEQTGNTVLSPLVSSYGTKGKFQVAFGLRRYTKTALQEHLDQPTGFGLYVAEYDCDTRTFMALNGAAKYGHVYTYTADKTAGVKAVPASLQIPFSVAEPETTRNTCILSVGISYTANGNPIILAFDDGCGKWKVWSTYYTAQSGQTYTDDFRIQAASSGWSIPGPVPIVRDDLDLYAAMRWQNNNVYHHQRFNEDKLDSFSVSGIYQALGEPDLSPRRNSLSTAAAYDASSSPSTGGRALASSYMYVTNDNNAISATIRVRVMLKGSSGNGDFSVFRAGTFLGYVRITSADGYGVWLERDIVTNTTFTTSQQIGIRWGINGGSTSMLVDWVDIFPTNSALQTEMREYVYKGTISRGFLPCP